MKKAFKVLLSSSFVLSIGLFAAIESYATEGTGKDPGELGRVTCYNTFTGTGTSSTNECLTCTVKEDIASYTDSGKCKK